MYSDTDSPKVSQGGISDGCTRAELDWLVQPYRKWYPKESIRKTKNDLGPVYERRVLGKIV